MLTLKLFGPGEAYYLDQPLDGFPSQQASLLLCYLLFNRHYPLNREQLAAVFWGESSTADSRKYLSKALWRLRSNLQEINVPVDEYLFINHHSISFLDSKQYWLDIEVFETSIIRYKKLNGPELTPRQAADLEEAVSLYTGELLEGIYEEWVLNERERLGIMYLNALTKLVDFHEARGSYERGLTYGRLILARDNIRERTHRQIMRLYWLSGDRTAALRQYKQCVQILQKELDAPPSQETEQLYQQMLHNQFIPANAKRPSPSPAPPDDLASVVKELANTQEIIKEAIARMHRLERIIASISP